MIEMTHPKRWKRDYAEDPAVYVCEVNKSVECRFFIMLCNLNAILYFFFIHVCYFLSDAKHKKEYLQIKGEELVDVPSEGQRYVEV